MSRFQVTVFTQTECHATIIVNADTPEEAEIYAVDRAISDQYVEWLPSEELSDKPFAEPTLTVKMEDRDGQDR